VVAADIPGAREIVSVTGMGRLVTPRDPAALAEGILEVAGNLDEYRARHGVALEVFDPEKTYDAYETLFQESLGS
jgi:glycosyltransferase involved in cell wall biosynthesis